MTPAAILMAQAIVLLALPNPQAIEKKDLLGCWQRTDEKPEEMMRFEEKRFVNVGKDCQQGPCGYFGRL